MPIAEPASTKQLLPAKQSQKRSLSSLPASLAFRLFLLTPIVVLVTIGSPFWFFCRADTYADKAFYGKGMSYAAV
jgi:hypothetical protein